jgi:integrase
MARAPFSVSERTTKHGVVWDARFFGSDGTVIKTIRITDAKNRTQAIRKAQSLHAEGIVPNTDNPDALEYIASFWQRDSDYVQGRALRGRVISNDYLYISARIVAKHATPFLKGLRMTDIDLKRIETMTLSLARSGISPRTINATIQAIRVPLTYFSRMHRLPNPLQYLDKLAENERERGILSLDELSLLLKVHTDDPRVRAAVLLAALCGLRLGEIRGLKWDDVDRENHVINVRGNYVSHAEGLKKPKWGHTRVVPLPEPVLEAIDCCRMLPYADSPYLLWNAQHIEHPVDSGTVTKGFYVMLREIGIDQEAREKRYLTLHGLRHLFITLSRANGIPDYLVMKMAGHKSIQMTERYSNHDTLIDFNDARLKLEKKLRVEEKKRKVKEAEQNLGTEPDHENRDTANVAG